MTLAVLARFTLVAGLVVVGSTSCRSHAGFRKQYQQSRNDLLKGDWATAAKKYESAKEDLFTEADRVMYWLNLGTLQHYARQWGPSQANFVKAEAAIQDLFTTSVTSEATKYTVSETLAPYEGEDFEKILLYFFTALNNFEQGKVNDALVEARRADEFLRKIRVRYDSDDKLSTIYKQDAFMLWLVGLFYEVEGSNNDAYLAYKRAFAVYQNEYRRLFRVKTPSYLVQDIIRTGRAAGLGQDVDDFIRNQRLNPPPMNFDPRGQAELIVIHAGGEAPFKKERNILHKVDKDYTARIALPQFVQTKPVIARSRVEVSGQGVPTQMAEPVTTIAMRNFKHQLPGIQARAIARFMVKYLATKGTKAAVEGGKKASDEAKAAGALIGLIGNIASVASENADLRSWNLLPSYFRVARVWVAPGQHTVKVTYADRRNQPVGGPLMVNVNARAGERRIISLRTVR